ncbi:hypothetical protein IJ579_00350 [bacterium]|nr:hypothetical protein [bacterium]
MVDSVNSNMHYGTTDVGILTPPDKLPKTTLYSYTEGQKMYNDMQHDIYVNSKKSKPKKKGFPLVLKITAAIGATVGLILGRKAIFNFFKGIFNKT